MSSAANNFLLDGFESNEWWFTLWWQGINKTKKISYKQDINHHRSKTTQNYLAIQLLTYIEEFFDC